ncbi:hypothetical protein [Rhodococcus sp. (in: high G+C Gram-positive bacteria)]|uniref:hypothetical protein n=1 Tax=Rhodococcus sp. TaxID=1831 RepID=UPI00257FC49B
MTRVTESLSSQLPDTFDQAVARVEDSFEETATRIKESDAADNARRIAAVVATATARGAGQLGLFLGRQSAVLAKKGVECAKSLPAKSAARAEREPKPRGRKRVGLFVIAGVAVIGGAVFYKSRHREHPPVASAPPRVDEQTA